jgi:hypothetical protein
VRNEEVLLRVKEYRNIVHEISKRKANWIGYILCRNCLLRQSIEGKIKWGIEVTGRLGWRRRRLLDGLKERRGNSDVKEEALDRTVWRAGFGRGFGLEWDSLINVYGGPDSNIDLDDIEGVGSITGYKNATLHVIGYKPFIDIGRKYFHIRIQLEEFLSLSAVTSLLIHVEVILNCS